MKRLERATAKAQGGYLGPALRRVLGGGPPPLSALELALAQFGFWAPLTTTVALTDGYGAASFTRATVATVKDWEGAIRNCVSGEVRFAGQRRVRNYIGTHTTNTTSVNGATSNATFTTGVSDPDGGTDAVTLTSTLANGSCYSNTGVNYPAGSTLVVSIWIRRRTGTGNINLTAGGATTNIASVVTSSWQRISAQFTATGSSQAAWQLALATSGDEVDIYKVQSEVVTGQSNKNPSEYVSVGAAKLNELIYTEEFDNAWWNKSNVSVTAGQADPLGGAGAELLQVTLTGLDRQMYRTAPTTATGTLTHSIYAKAGTTNWVSLSPFDGGTRQAVWFDLANGVVGTTHASVTATITSVGNGWYRLTATSTVVSAPGYCSIEVVDGDGSATGTAGANAYFFGFQIERASSAGAYFPVGSVYPYHGACVDGVRYFDTLNGNTVASNVVTEATGAAIDQTGNVGYLAESARTNLVLQSSNLGTSWSVTGTPTRSAAAAYCGEIALDLIGDDDAGAQEGYRQDITFTGDATKSVSFLVKQGTSTSSIVQLLDTIAAADRLAVAVTWSGGVPVCTYATGSAERASEYMGGGVWRIFCLSSSVTAANTNSLRFYPAKTVADALTPTGDIYIGGVQAENATTASASHIPTTTATVTRNADVMTYAGAGNISQTEGAGYASFIPCQSAGGLQGILEIGDGSANERVSLNRSSGGNATLTVADGGVTQAAISAGAMALSTAYGLAGSFAVNDFAAVLDGGTVGTDAAGTLPTTTTIYVGQAGGGSQANGVIRNIRVATTRVSDADLQLITA